MKTSSKPSLTCHPEIIVGDIALNSCDVVRVTLGEYQGRKTVSFRKYFRSGDELRPTPKGLTVAIHHLPEIARLASDALDRAIDDGFLPENDGAK